MVTLNSGKPELLSLRQIIDAFLEFRVEIVVKRTTYLLNKSRDRAHVLVGLAIAIANIDEIISVIRSSPDPASARDYMLKKKWIPKNVDSLIKLIDDPRHKIAEDGSYMLSIEQVQAILDLRLQRLTAIGRDEIEKELNSIGQDIKKYLEILSNRQVLDNIIEEELNNSKDSFGNPRRTEIMDIELDVDDEDLIPKQDVVITVSHKGYIKRVPLSTYRSQRRGGKGRAGMSTRDEDFVTQIFVENTHTPILFFSSTGIVYKMKGYKLPQGTPQSKGKAMINLLPLSEGENITTIMPLPENEEEWENLLLMFATENGNVRKNKLSDFVDVRSNGKIAMKLQDDDKIKSVETCTDNDDILITTSKGQCIRFRVKDVRLFVGRSSTGVRGIKLAKDNRVISATIINALNATTEERLAYIKMSKAVRGDLEQEVEINEDSIEDADPTVLSDEKYAEMGASEQFILSISNNGFGKRTSTYEYRVTGRGGKGIIAMVVNERNGDLSDSFPVDPSNQIILVTDKGKLIRCPVDDIRIASRSTQGVKIFDIDNEEQVVSVERLGDIEADDDGEADHIEDLDDE
jgi:DNA gyrase subunit A